MKLTFTKEFDDWHSALKDTKAKHIISVRLHRLVNGNAGDAQPIGDGLSELRVHFGSGFRIYFKQTEKELIVILCGGDKDSQERDIKRAKTLAKMLKEV